jgi:hypothetical protein
VPTFLSAFVVDDYYRQPLGNVIKIPWVLQILAPDPYKLTELLAMRMLVLMNATTR